MDPMGYQMVKLLGFWSVSISSSTIPGAYIAEYQPMNGAWLAFGSWECFWKKKNRLNFYKNAAVWLYHINLLGMLNMFFCWKEGWVCWISYGFVYGPKLGGGFKCFLFSPRKLGKMNPFWRYNIFQRGWFNHQPDSFTAQKCWRLRWVTLPMSGLVKLTPSSNCDHEWVTGRGFLSPTTSNKVKDRQASQVTMTVEVKIGPLFFLNLQIIWNKCDYMTSGYILVQ